MPTTQFEKLLVALREIRDALRALQLKTTDKITLRPGLAQVKKLTLEEAEDVLVRDTGLGIRARHAMTCLKVENLRQFVEGFENHAEAIISCRNCGTRTVRDVQAWMAQYGFQMSGV